MHGLKLKLMQARIGRSWRLALTTLTRERRACESVASCGASLAVAANQGIGRFASCAAHPAEPKAEREPGGQGATRAQGRLELSEFADSECE